MLRFVALASWAAASVSAAAPPQAKLCGIASAGAWHGGERPYQWRTADGCEFAINTLADFQLAFAGRSLVIMGDSVSRDVALAAPMRYAGCDALERAGVQSEAVLGPNEVAHAWCPARRLFHVVWRVLARVEGHGWTPSDYLHSRHGTGHQPTRGWVASGRQDEANSWWVAQARPPRAQGN